MEIFLKKNAAGIAGALVCILAISFIFDQGLSIGLGLLVILSGLTFLVLKKLGFEDKKIYWLFLIVVAIHLATTLFMHYTNFQPFAGGQGDELGYQRWAIEAAQCFRQGIFSVQGIVAKYPDFYVGHVYPLVIGVLYALTMPQVIIGLMFNIWLVALTITFVYLIILEIGLSKEQALKNGFVIGLILAIYPSYVFNSGLLLKDTLEISFIILALLFLIKTIKKFTGLNFLVLYLATFCATHFRFYIGYAVILSFIFSWFFFANMNLKKRLLFGMAFIILFGFIPQIAFNQGYYGANSIRDFLNAGQLTYYRQMAWNPAYNVPTPTSSSISSPTSSTTSSVPGTFEPAIPASLNPGVKPATTGFDSSFSVEKGPLGYIESFIYVLLGPFPWQIKFARQALALFETIPWYLLLFFVVDGTLIIVKKRLKSALPLLIFSFIVAVVIAIFDKNFGLIVRIRIPVFISLLCVASLSFWGTKYINLFWQKITNAKP